MKLQTLLFLEAIIACVVIAFFILLHSPYPWEWEQLDWAIAILSLCKLSFPLWIVLAIPTWCFTSLRGRKSRNLE